MKRIKLFLLLIILSLTLSGCDWTDIFQKQPCTKEECLVYETDEITQLILDTSEQIRESNIHIKKTVYEKNALGGPRLYAASSAEGSGFVFYSDQDYYYALTNFHVVDIEISQTRLYSVEYEITVNYTSIKTNVSVVAQGDNIYDIAVLRFPKNDLQIPLMPLTPRLESQAILNEFILIVGNPGGQINVVSTSKVISVCRCLSGIPYNVLYFEYNMKSPGNSGGAVTDIHGNVLGMITWQNPENFKRKFAIPLAQIVAFLENNQVPYQINTENNT